MATKGLCKLKIKHLLLVREISDERGITLHSLKKHNVSNEDIVDFDVPGAIDYLHRTANPNEADSRTLPSMIVIDVSDREQVVDFVSKVKSHATTELIPIVAFTEENTDSTYSELYAAGANSVIPKPEDPEQLSEVILNAMMYWTLLNLNPD